MRPIRLRATNFRTFATLDLELRSGLHGILGELRDAPDGADSNGAGKSSILEAIDIALFGRRSLAGFLTRGGDVTELMLELTFEHGGSAYKVRRTFSARTKAGKTTCDFECWQGEPLHSGDDEGPRWEPLTRSSTKETDALIVETVGLTRDTFRNSSYLRQGDGSYADPARDPKQRKDLLVEAALGRDPVWPKLVDAAKTAKRAAQSQLERIAGETRAARELVDGKPDIVLDHVEAIAAETEAAAELATAEASLQTLLERHAAAKEGAARRQTVEAELAAAKQALAVLEERNAAANAAARTIVEANTRLEELGTAPETTHLEQRVAELTAAIDAHREAVRVHESTKQAAAHADSVRAQYDAQATASENLATTARTKARDLEAAVDEKTCDHCGQTLTDEARAIAIASYLTEAQELEQAAAAHRLHAQNVAAIAVRPAPEGEPPVEALRAVQAQLSSAQRSAAERAGLLERIRQCEPAAASGPLPDALTAAHQAVIDKQAELDDIEPVNLQTIEAAGALVRANVTAARAALDAAKATKARLDERLAQIVKAEAQLAAATVQEAELQAAVDVETVIERACGRDGIPALIIENHAIPYIEAEANRILGADGLKTSMRVELRTQQALKDGSGLRDTLEVVVIDPNGNEADFQDGISGGQQTRVSLALRIALARLLANRRGAESRLLALDEPTALDASGMRALLEVLNGLQSEFDLILLVSHVPELRDSLEQWLLVVNEGGDRSRIEGAAVLEPAVEAAAAA